MSSGRGGSAGSFPERPWLAQEFRGFVEVRKGPGHGAGRGWRVGRGARAERGEWG